MTLPWLLMQILSNEPHRTGQGLKVQKGFLWLTIEIIVCYLVLKVWEYRG